MLYDLDSAVQEGVQRWAVVNVIHKVQNIY
jgi:hypothetical protein